MRLFSFLIFITYSQLYALGIRPLRIKSLWLKGGSSQISQNLNIDNEKNIIPLSTQPQNIKVIILTNAGSPHLDFKTRFQVSSDDTVYNIKKQIQDKMVGNPPISLQRLVFGLRLFSYSF